MSAQASTDAAAAPNWSGWQSAVVNGVYPLHRLLNGSERSAIFLTERKGRTAPEAAIKIIPIERLALAQLSHWKAATALSHPHLMQLFDTGLGQFGGHQFLFVVMEYAQQTLCEVLRQRALTPDEVRELLPPTLGALTFLHGQGLVHSQLKPANVLVVNDQLKLSSDGIRPAGAPRVGLDEPSWYDPPEASHATFASAGDIWGLGMTLVEALTQCIPVPDEQSGATPLPATVPQEFVDTLQGCLSYDPATRPSATQLAARFGWTPKTPPVPIPEAVARETPRVAPAPRPPGRRERLPGVAAIVSLMILAAIWTGWRLYRPQANSRQSISVPGKLASPQADAPAIAPQNPLARRPESAATAAASTHVQMPNASRRALATIHGHFRITVLVVVDRSGTVIRALLKNTGPSSYFARLSREAAKKSRFAAADESGTREWLLRYEFTRGGITGDAIPGP